MNKNTRRTLLKTIAAAGLLEGAGLSGLISNVLAKGNSPVAAGLRKITGTVTVNGASASVGMLIKAGDTVTTGAASEAIYVIDQDAFLQRDNSSVVFGDGSAEFFRRVLSRSYRQNIVGVWKRAEETASDYGHYRHPRYRLLH